MLEARLESQMVAKRTAKAVADVLNHGQLCKKAKIFRFNQKHIM